MHWILMPFRRLTDFGGRSSRIEFWIFWLAALTLQMVASYIDAATAQPLLAAGMGPVTMVVTLVLLMPAATVGIRRLHDTGRSGWWMLLIGLPYLGWLVSAQTGAMPIGAALVMLIGSIALLILLVQPGTAGANDYGPDPKPATAANGIADQVATP